MHSTAEHLIDALRADGARITEARRAICRVLADDHDRHLDANQIRDRASAVAGQEIDPSTVYRTIDVLERIGVLRHVHLGHGPSIVHFADRTAHHHLVCSDCGLIIDVAADELASMIDALGARFGFQIDGVHFALEGRCADCSAASTGNGDVPSQDV